MVDEFKIVRHSIHHERADTGDATFVFTFFVEGPEGRHPISLTITWPSGNSATIEPGKEFMLPFNPIGSTRLRMPVNLENVRPGPYKVSLSIAGEELGEFPFTVQ